MKTYSFLSKVALTVLIALATSTAWADIAIPLEPYVRPDELQKPIGPTIQAHFTVAQHALELSRKVLKDFLHGQNTIAYGGYLERADADLSAALAANAKAIAFVKAHPDSDALASGPAPANEPAAPSLPKVNQPIMLPNEYLEVDGKSIQVIPMEAAVDALEPALSALIYKTTSDFHGPVLDEIDGHRRTLIAAIAQVGTDFTNAYAYYLNTAGGDTGIIPIAQPAGVVSADPKYGPKARTYLTEVQDCLRRLDYDLDEKGEIWPKAFTGDKTQGGYVSKVKQDVKLAKADITAALAYLDTHPEADRLVARPTGMDPFLVRHAIAPVGAPRPNLSIGYRQWMGNPTAGPINLATFDDLNKAYGWLQNVPAAPHDPHTMPGDLGGFFGKILDDLTQTAADMAAGIDFTATKDRTVKIPGAQKNPRVPVSSYAESYSERGNYKLAKGDPAAAIADFDQAISLDPEDVSSFRDRSLAREAQGDFVGALADNDAFFKYYASIKEDIESMKYERFRRDLLQRRLHRGDAATELANQVARWKDGWPKTVGFYLSGALTEEDFLAQVEKGDAKTVREHQCEAGYYVGMTQLLAGDSAAARRFFAMCLATDERSFTEFWLAGPELARLDAKK